MKRKESDRDRAFNRFDLNLLRVLDVLLEEKNVTHAANRMHVSQPAISGALQRMREFFNDQLLVRVGREMELTPYARSLVGPIRELLHNIRTTLDLEPKFDPGASKLTFFLAMSDYAAFVLMPKVLTQLAAQAPYVACEVELLNETTFNRLSANDVEFCVASDDWRLYGNFEPGTDIRTVPLFSDQFVCVVDRTNPLIADEVSLDNYKRMPHSTVRLGRGMSSIVERSWAVADLSLNIAATAPSFSALIFMLPGTPMIATVQARLARMLAPALNLKQVECPIVIPQLREVLAWHARNDFNPAHQFVRGIIEEAAREIEAETQPSMRLS
jgi:LysR family transcriptional regulator, nod-box dependent transcriptional activator